MMGHKEMYAIMEEKNAIYMIPMRRRKMDTGLPSWKLPMAKWADGPQKVMLAELLSQYGHSRKLPLPATEGIEWPAESEVLLAQALFAILICSFLTSLRHDLDAKTIAWLADFLADFKNTVIVVSHDRYFLDMVCTHTVDIDFRQIKMFTGNYTFWYESSQLIKRQREAKNKKIEQKRKECRSLSNAFAANAAKSRQATSRKKSIGEAQSRRYAALPAAAIHINFTPDRKPGDQILRVENLSKRNEAGDLLFSNVNFTFAREDKIAVICENLSCTHHFL